MYLLLDDNGRERIRQDRLLALEREHYALVLQLAEMDAVGLPDGTRGRQLAVADLHTIEAAINWHRSEIDPPQRVEPGEQAASGDDEPVTQPLGEEAST